MFRSLSLSPVVKNLLLLNIGIYIAESYFGFQLKELCGLRSMNSDKFIPYQFFSHIFLHHGSIHLISNMLVLYMLGPVLEMELKSKNFLILYIVAGIGASLLYSGMQYIEMEQLSKLCQDYLSHPSIDSFCTFVGQYPQEIYNEYYEFTQNYAQQPTSIEYINHSKFIIKSLYTLKVDTIVVGASGAIFGILMGFAMIFPNVKLYLLFIPVPIRAKYFVALYAIYELYAGLQRNPIDNTAHFAHLGGMLCAYLLLVWWNKRAGHYSI